jgi:hypothetical protein
MANKAVFGIYATRSQIESAIDELKAKGFRNTDISVLFPENVGTKDFAHEKGTKAPEGIAAGASSGAVIGGALGWLAGIGALAIPGLGPFIAEKIENHAAAVALGYFAYNFIKIHSTLRVTPAMAAGVTDRLWEVSDLVALLEADEQGLERAA